MSYREGAAVYGCGAWGSQQGSLLNAARYCLYFMLIIFFAAHIVRAWHSIVLALSLASKELEEVDISYMHIT